MEHFVSASCNGELCGMCYREDACSNIPAMHKLGEEMPYDYPMVRHNATQYVCCKHFAIVVGPQTAKDWAGCQL